MHLNKFKAKKEAKLPFYQLNDFTAGTTAYDLSFSHTHLNPLKL